MSGKRVSTWTPHRRGFLARLFDDGLSDDAIAERMKLSVRAIAIQRPKQGLLRARAKPRAAGVKSYTTGTLMIELRRRGFSVQVTRKPT